MIKVVVKLIHWISLIFVLVLFLTSIYIALLVVSIHILRLLVCVCDYSVTETSDNFEERFTIAAVQLLLCSIICCLATPAA